MLFLRIIKHLSKMFCWTLSGCDHYLHTTVWSENCYKVNWLMPQFNQLICQMNKTNKNIKKPCADKHTELSYTQSQTEFVEELFRHLSCWREDGGHARVTALANMRPHYAHKLRSLPHQQTAILNLHSSHRDTMFLSLSFGGFHFLKHVWHIQVQISHRWRVLLWVCGKTPVCCFCIVVYCVSHMCHQIEHMTHYRNSYHWCFL